MSERKDRMPGRWREPLVFLLFLAGAMVFTYPLVRNLRTAVTDHVDPLLDAWALSWVAHQLPRDPVHLFDSNRFYPEKGTLAFNDPMVGVGAVLAPVQWAFGEPILALNLGMLFALALSGYGAYRLAAYLTASPLAGAVAGSIFAFNSYRMDHVAHMQLQAAGFIPLLYVCLHRYVEEGRPRHAVGIAVFLWFVCASSAYYGIFTWILLAIAIPYELWRTSSPARPRRILGLGLALSISALAYLPLAIPFMRLRSDFGVERPLPRLQRASARPSDYLRSGSHVHRAAGLKPASAERSLFPGFLALGLSLVAFARPNRALGLYLLLGATAFWASLGPAWGLYRLLYESVPGLSGVRVPPRLAIYVLLAASVLAAYGAALVLRKIPASSRSGAAAIFAALPLVESFAGPIPYNRAPEVPEVYRWVARLPGTAPIVELPLPELKRQRDNAVYLYWSTTHFQPLANGYGTVVPPVYADLVSTLRTFPDERGVAKLSELGFRYVIFHRDRYLRSRAEELERRLDAAPGLTMAHEAGSAVVYEIRHPGRR
ncbi:MAG: hypothetical protein ACRD3V_15145 [Vicinamibacteria bacterium]